jgi:hypothetical protein
MRVPLPQVGFMPLPLLSQTGCDGPSNPFGLAFQPGIVCRISDHRSEFWRDSQGQAVCVLALHGGISGVINYVDKQKR